MANDSIGKNESETSDNLSQGFKSIMNNRIARLKLLYIDAKVVNNSNID